MARGNAFLIIERILRDRSGVWRQIGEERDLGRLIGQMLTSSALAFALYGAVLGASHSVAQAALSAVKLPLLFFITLAICLPTLYLFNLVFGARLQVRQAVALVMVTITVTAVLSLAFAPISLFFLITANKYAFYKLLNVAVLALSALVGLRFLTAGMTALNAQMARQYAERQAAELVRTGATAPAAGVPTAAGRSTGPDADGLVKVPVSQPVLMAAEAQAYDLAVPNGQSTTGYGAYPGSHHLAQQHPAQHHPGQQQPGQPFRMPQRAAGVPGEKPASMTLLYVWILLFGFVGTQLAWTLRPFVGSPGKPFQVFREIDGNFYVDIARTIGLL